MDDGLIIEVKGLAELQAKLEDLSTKQVESATRKALRAGAVIEQAAIIERAPVKVDDGGILPEGALKSDIVIKMRRDDQGNQVAVVGPDKFTRRVAAWVEYGHRIVTGGYSKVLENGKTRGPGKVHADRVKAYPFIRPAFEATEQEVAKAITSTFIEEIEKAAAKKK